MFGDTNRTQQQTQNALNAYAGTAGNIWNQQQGYANDIFNRGNTQLNTDVNAQNAQAFANQQQALQGQTRENARAADLARVGLGRLGALGNTSQSLLTLGDVGQRGQEQLGNLNQQFGAQQLQQNAQALQGRNQLSDIYQNRLAGIGQGQLGTVQDIYGNQNQLNNNYLNQRGQIVNQGAQNAINQGQGQVGISQGNQNWQGNLGNQAYQTINNLQQQQQQMNNDYQNQRAQIMQNLAGNDVARATALQQLETEFFNNQRAVEMQKLQAEEQARVNDRNFYNADRAYGLDYATTQYNINQPSS